MDPYSTLVPVLKSRVLYSQPERGDVAVFREPRNEGTSFIKRVIGLPGDTVQVKDGILYINGTEVPRKKVDPYREQTPAGQHHLSRSVSLKPCPMAKAIMLLKLAAIEAFLTTRGPTKFQKDFSSPWGITAMVPAIVAIKVWAWCRWKIWWVGLK